MAAPIRVLVVDDSAFARKVLREVLQAAGFEVVGIARDGLEALEQIALLKPDVVTLDLVMPNLDGIGVLRALPKEHAPRVVVVSISNDESELGIEALQAGALTIVEKPTALATTRLYELERALTRAVKEAALARNIATRPIARPPLMPLLGRAPRVQLVAIGTSTGGPQALSRLLPMLPKAFPVPIVIALHIPAGYTAELAKRLDRNSQIEVVEASQGLLLRPGLAVLAQGGHHLKLKSGAHGLEACIDDEPRSEPHAPSVDVMFESAVAQLAGNVQGVVLTGMGSDGLRGARAIHAAGGHVLTEAAASCVVFGMPAVVKDAGLSRAEALLDDMALAILTHL
jgi:two-component system, chemotaxis family, protein-glutamate methylesterase/glutaminase